MKKPYRVLVVWLVIASLLMAGGLGACLAAAEGVLPLDLTVGGLLVAVGGFFVFIAGVIWFMLRAPTPRELAEVRPVDKLDRFHMTPLGVAYFVGGVFLMPGLLKLMPAGPERTLLFFGWLGLMVLIPAVPKLRAKVFVQPTPRTSDRARTEE